MSEDAAKVDVKFSFRHIANPRKLITAHAQVKSGPSYRRSANSHSITLGIDKETISALSGTGMPGLVIWVPPPPMNRLYWYATDPRAPAKTVAKVKRSQYVRPSLRYDLSRLYDYASWSRRYTKQTVGIVADSQVLPKAKAAYSALQAINLPNPLVGPLKITRLAWRHITRRSKSSARRTLSLRVVPYLKAFISSPPDRYACNFEELRDEGSSTVETRLLLCWYRQAVTINDESYSVLVRIKEEIRYPANWASRPLGDSEVTQIATLASWWCKKDK
jgi:hypothetical protein